MSYLAIARKYRPSTFDEIVGQDHVVQTLKNAITADRVHHAFLFTGARGVGKTTAARALARALSCFEGPTPTPCGVCVACTEILAGASPDLIEIDGASNNSVDDVREIRDAVRYAPSRGRWKVYLVDEVHMLSKAAFNALLKTLEEPPPHVVFIFATTEPNKIPDTILSRVQRFDFKRIGVPGVVGRLREIADAEGVTVSDEALRLIARAGEGSMRDAQSLLDQVIAYGGTTVTDAQVVENLGLIDRSLLYDTLRGLIEGRPEGCLDAIERVYDYGYELAQFTAELLELLRNAAFVRLSPGTRKHLDVGADELATLEQLTEGVDGEVFTRLFDALLEVHDQVAKAGRPRIVLEMAVARLATVRPLQPVGALVGRLEQLERSLAHRGAPVRAAPLRGGDAPAPPQAPTRAAPRGAEQRAPRGGPGGSAAGSPSTREADPGRSTTPPVRRPDGAEQRPDVKPTRPEASAPRPEPQEPVQSGPAPAPRTPAPPPTEARPASKPVPPARRSPAPPAAPPPPRVAEPPVVAAEPVPPRSDWDALVEALPDTALITGIAAFEGSTLRITLDAGVTLARARRELREPRVQRALQAHYPADVQIELIERAAGSAQDPATRAALEHPGLARIVRTLDARVTAVTSELPEE